MSTRIFAALVAGALMVPQAALGGGFPPASPGDASPGDNLSLPPIPFAETIPWLAHAAPPKIEIPKVLLTPGTMEYAAMRLELRQPAIGALPAMVTSPVSLTTSRQ